MASAKASRKDCAPAVSTDFVVAYDNASHAAQAVTLAGTGADFGLSISPSAVTLTPDHSIDRVIAQSRPGHHRGA